MIDYKVLLADAYLNVVREALGTAADDPVMGKYCFEMVINNAHEDNVIPDWLKAQYPGMMTIFINKQYADLIIDDHHFSVILHFGGVAANLVVSFDSILYFHDPIFKFKVAFEVPEDINVDETVAAVTPEVDSPESSNSNKIVSLDDWRKKD